MSRVGRRSFVELTDVATVVTRLHQACLMVPEIWLTTHHLRVKGNRKDINSICMKHPAGLLANPFHKVANIFNSTLRLCC